VQIGDNRAAEWVRRSNPVALGLLFSGLAGQQYCTALLLHYQYYVLYNVLMPFYFFRDCFWE
jgi:hypothetical protein